MQIRDFSLRHTIESGQPLTFYSDYSRRSGAEQIRYATLNGEITIRIRNQNLSYSYKGDYTDQSASAEIKSRLGLEDDMQQIYGHIGTDQFMKDAIESFYGMRITRNDPWEASLCFVISQFNNMKRIRGIIGSMINRFGDSSDGVRLFPTPEALAEASIQSIRGCGTGFRDRYIKSVAEQFAFSFDKSGLYKMNYVDAKEKLMELDGIGDKVADCILLFGYNKLEAFPIDTWVKRVMERVYFNGRKKPIRRLHEFANGRWPAYCLGYAQQYIFWNGRENKIG